MLNSSTATLAIGLGALVLVAGAIGGWFWRRQRPEAAGTGAAAARNKDELLESIAELDDEYAAGQVPEADYRPERAALKQRLLKVWE